MSSNLRDKFPSKVPVIVEKSSKERHLPDIPQTKYAQIATLTLSAQVSDSRRVHVPAVPDGDPKEIESLKDAGALHLLFVVQNELER